MEKGGRGQGTEEKEGPEDAKEGGKDKEEVEEAA